MRSRHGGRLLITPTRTLPEGARETEEAGPGRTAERFGPKFDAYCRRHYARSVDEAGNFVDFIDPVPGSAAVEVGAGTGRITVDGGLASRIGRDGALLITDPAPAQFRQAQRRLCVLDASWMRGALVPAEHLPLAQEGAVLVVGGLCWYLLNGECAVRELHRVLRPGGRVALSSGLAFDWPPGWQETLQPIQAALSAHNLPLRHTFPEPGAIARYLTWAGMNFSRRLASTRPRRGFLDSFPKLPGSLTAA